VALALTAVAWTYDVGSRLGMVRTLNLRHTLYSLPYAISHRYFGARGYVIFQDIADVFLAAHPNVTNETLAQAIASKPSRERLMFFPGDDKGYADFVILAFRVFGMRIESLYDFWFAIYLIGIAAFVVVFWKQPPRLAALVIITLAVYAAFFALGLTEELRSVHNPRAFGIVSFIPLVHLSLVMIDRHRLTAPRVAAAAVQAVLVAFSIHVRSSEWWQALAIGGVATWVFMRDRSPRDVFWPCAVVVAALVGLDVYQRIAVDDVYNESHLRHRVFWHNVGIGFALNPNLARIYSLQLDDLPMIRLVRRRLADSARSEDLARLFRPPGQEDYLHLGITKDFSGYERVAREVVLSIVWHHKWEALRTFVYDKPRVLMMQVAWAIGYREFTFEDMHVEGQIGSLASEHRRVGGSTYLNPFRKRVLAGLVVALLVAGAAQRRRDYAQITVLAAWLLVMSVVPSIAAYPLVSSIGLVFVTLPFMVLTAAAYVASVVTSSMMVRLSERGGSRIEVRADVGMPDRRPSDSTL
jgi:hypothetical protein